MRWAWVLPTRNSMHGIATRAVAQTLRERGVRDPEIASRCSVHVRTIRRWLGRGAIRTPSWTSLSLDSFWARVDQRRPTECWPWTARVNRQSYGLMFGRNNVTILAHRFAWELAHLEPAPQGMCVCHSCDNPPCCNPAHLWLGTSAENQADRKAKGRHAFGEQSGRAKLTEWDVIAIRLDRRPHLEIALAFGVSDALVSMVQNRRAWKHIQ